MVSLRAIRSLVRPATASFMYMSAVLLLPATVIAQNAPKAMYEQASEVSGWVIQYQQDMGAIRDFYAPYNLNDKGEDQGKYYVLQTPEERKRLNEVANDYLQKLKSADFNGMSIYGKVDYILLKKEINSDLLSLKNEENKYAQITSYIPFAETIYKMEKQRRRGVFLNGQDVAGQLNNIIRDLRAASLKIKKADYIEGSLARMSSNAVFGIQRRLKNVVDFYNGYDPMFTWWVPQTYTQLDTALANYASLLRSKAKVITTQKPDSSGIKGVPIGRDELMSQLKAEMIPYTPEELIALANKEFAWCDKEMLKASQEMGFGNNWKAALEKVKNSYVPAGHQPELIIKLYDDAVNFIKANDLITIPPLAEETWGMIMMTPERQLVNPFFTGGKEISVSYPTNTMSEQDKLMSMRGNNPYFSRGTVQHELIPGHNLQYFMNSRYKAYRGDFGTPFAVEGWPLYWELLLYNKGFAKTPEERVGMLFWRMHRCARIIFSLNYHLGNWTPQQCINFLVDRVGHERANAEGEVRRSFAGGYSPLYQVAYLVGGLQLWGLKQELVDSGKMTFKQFHDAVMKENLIPIEMVRATLTDQQLTPDFTTSWRFYDLNKNSATGKN
ncbi:MAG: X-Pro dipeptidyl-peptidase [Mucilaginibacter sp. 44-25]|nr:MAG: X-Pro dipeptidyl-peptidase [Mucilaginibacter sp. 44-25]